MIGMSRVPADGADAPAFLWPIPEKRDGRRFRLGEPPAGATRQAGSFTVLQPFGCACWRPASLVARCRPPRLSGVGVVFEPGGGDGGSGQGTAEQRQRWRW
jgi:hypothetical protein